MNKAVTIPDTLRAVSSQAATDLSLLALDVQRVPSSKRRAPHFALILPQGQCTFRLRRVADHIELEIRGATEEARRVLRSVLVTHGGLTQKKGEHHRLDIFPAETGSPSITAAVAGWAQRIAAYAVADNDLLQRHHTRSHAELALWWEGQSNFGDLLSPWLISTLTGKPVLNARYARTEQPVIAGIGSIIHMASHGVTNIWGSGLMYPPTPRQTQRLLSLHNVRVHAVRGHLTRKTLIEHLGWDVPEVYGDPALLLPRYLPIDRGEGGRSHPIALVPHYKHQDDFPRPYPENVDVIDVREDLRTVVSAIASSRVCLSTSLHGIIIAQAYGVPWVWLKLEGHGLPGGDFKFDDFFSTLDAEAVSCVELSTEELADLDAEAIAENARLPDLRINLDALDAAFPLPRATHPRPSDPPKFSWRDIPAEDAAAAMSRVAVRRLKQGRKAVRHIPLRVKQKLPF